MILMRSESPRQVQSSRKAKVSREHGACEACKASKTKCDGGEPCGACRKEKRKSRPCEYSEKAQRMRTVKREQQKRIQLSDEQGCEPEEISYLEIMPQPPTDSGFDEEYTDYPVPSRIEFRSVVEEFIKVKGAVKGHTLSSVKQIEQHWNNLSLQTVQSMTITSSIPESDDLPAESPDLWKVKLDNIVAEINQGKLRAAYTQSIGLVREIESSRIQLPTPSSSLTSPISGSGLAYEIYIQLLEFDCILAFFEGGWPYLPPYIKSRYLKHKPLAGEDSIIKEKLEVLDQVQQLLALDTSTDQGVVEFAQFVHDIRDDARQATALIRMAFCITSSHSADRQRLKLFSNLVLAAMYCRAASICHHCSHKPVPPTNGSRSDIVVNDGYHKARTKTDHCKSLVKHAGMALEAFDQLCQFDAKSTSGDFFLLHGAIAAATLMGLHALREKNATWEGKEGRDGKDGTKGDKARLVDAEASFRKLHTLAPTSSIINHALKLIPDILYLRTHPRPRTDGGRESLVDHDGEDSDCSPCTESSPEAMDNIPLPRSLKRSFEHVDNSQYPTTRKAQKLNAHVVPPQPEPHMFTPNQMRPIPPDYPNHSITDMDPGIARACEFGQPQSFAIAQPYPATTTQSVSHVPIQNESGAYMTLDGHPYLQPVGQKQELHVPQVIPDNAFTDHEQRVYYDPSYTSPHEHPSFVPTQYSSMPNMRSAQQQLTSPPSVSQHGPSIYSQAPMAPALIRQNVDTGTTFFNSTQKTFEPPPSIPMDPALTERPGAPPRRHSDLAATHYQPGPTEQQARGWKLEADARTSPLHDSPAHLGMLPPRPESIVTYQPDPHTLPTQPFFQDYNGTGFAPTQIYDQYGLHPPMLVQDMHYMHQQQPFFQGVTMA